MLRHVWMKSRETWYGPPVAIQKEQDVDRGQSRGGHHGSVYWNWGGLRAAS